LEQRYGAIKREARKRKQAMREALGSEMKAACAKWVEGSAHVATLETGSWRVVLDVAVEALPDEYVVTTRTADVSKLKAALSRAENRRLPFAHLERGPTTVRITLIDTSARRRG
jgi:hypothetical protein